MNYPATQNDIDVVFLDTPIGTLRVEAGADGLTAIRFMGEMERKKARPATPSPLLEKAQQQLTQYFKGERKSFDLPVEPKGTSFERAVWQQLKDIPFGKSITYKQLAQKLGDTKKVRAVGRANGQNPLPIIIPCHRVIGTNNKLTGYAGGVERKRWLLQHEGVLLL